MVYMCQVYSVLTANTLCQLNKNEYLGWHADGSLHLQALLLSPTDQVGTDWELKKQQKKLRKHRHPAFTSQ